MRELVRDPSKATHGKQRCFSPAIKASFLEYKSILASPSSPQAPSSGAADSCASADVSAGSSELGVASVCAPSGSVEGVFEEAAPPPRVVRALLVAPALPVALGLEVQVLVPVHRLVALVRLEAPILLAAPVLLEASALGVGSQDTPWGGSPASPLEAHPWEQWQEGPPEPRRHLGLAQSAAPIAYSRRGRSSSSVRRVPLPPSTPQAAEAVPPRRSPRAVSTQFSSSRYGSSTF
eukprot:CAMPEP_0113248678 /NCGR_PEP_ID=MMETSP0008_2-20120614/10646_1 /TAXON_ID=97485 /ORGANISM="Prymnesium parvum" /LENGTH=234 /DNA_ID=CAMNT_0000096545 /DNA_START=415 /DNA_END=1116 /DNA_ORIENTATION=+ /assembly_acc=CAM_ASM_000153